MNNNFSPLWQRVISKIQQEIASRLNDIGIVGTRIDAGYIRGTISTVVDWGILTTLGDIIYRGVSIASRLAGNTTATKKFLTQTGTGTVSAAPEWGTIADADIPASIARDTELHSAITLDVDADMILSLSTQELGLDVQNANKVLAGPTTGADADPAFRALVAADLPAEAIVDGDFTPAEGFMHKTGAGTYTAHKSNLASAADPAVTDDAAAGYSVGSLWINTTLDKVFQCVDSTNGAAVWKDLSTGSGDMTKAVYDPNADGVIAKAQLDAALANTSGTNTGDNVEVAAQAIGFTITKGTTPKTLTVALDANVAGTNTGDQTLAGLGGVAHSLATAANDFLVASGAGAFVKQTLAQVKTLLDWAADIATHAAIVATDSVKAHASFATADFTVASGAVSIKKEYYMSLYVVDSLMAAPMIHTNPGTTYVRFTTPVGNSTSFAMDWTAFPAAPTHIRLSSGYIGGNEAGAGKGMEIYNYSQNEVLAALTWDGNTDAVRSTGWVSLAGKTMTGTDDMLMIYVKGASATEDIRSYSFFMQIKRSV